MGQRANVSRHKEDAQRGFRQQARLDRDQPLIDHIVYRLYGLTDDEIAIVEAGP